MKYLLLTVLLFCGCVGDVSQSPTLLEGKKEKKEKSNKTISEITDLISESEYGRENALRYYWLFRMLAEQILADTSIDAYKAEQIARDMTLRMGLRRGKVEGFDEAIQKALAPWTGESEPEGYPKEFCKRLMEIAESCKAAE